MKEKIKGKWIQFKDWHRKSMRNPDFKKEYDALDAEFRHIYETLKAGFAEK